MTLSLVVHANGVLVAVAVMSLNPDGCATTDLPLVPFEVALVPEEEAADPQKKDPDLEKLKKEEEKEKKEEKDLKGQVVEVAPPKEEQQPRKARFLSEFDTSVKRETRAPPVPFRPGALIPPRPVQVPDRPPPTPAERREIQKKVMDLAMRARPEVPRSSADKGETGDARPPAPTRPAPRAPSLAEPASPPRRLDRIKLDQRDLERILGRRVNDHLADVEDGQETLLNSRRWRFASFFNRVKRQVAENWRPDVAYRRRDPTGNVYGFRDRLTILRVRLTPEGRLKEVHLENASGVGFLDDEAIAAFRAAEPFPNPPSGLVDKGSGLISFRFGFLFEISRRPQLRIFRNEE